MAAVVLVVPGLVAALGALAYWMAGRGIDGGDLPGDARTRVVARSDGTILVEVVNPASSSIAVGCCYHPSVTPPALAMLSPRLVVRPARWVERRRADRGAAEFLGAIEAHSQRQWFLPAPRGRYRLNVILGLPGARLRIHDHALPALAH